MLALRKEKPSILFQNISADLKLVEKYNSKINKLSGHLLSLPNNIWGYLVTEGLRHLVRLGKVRLS